MNAIAAAQLTIVTPTIVKPACFVAGPFGEPGSRARAWSDLLCKLLPRAIGEDYTIVRTIDDPQAGSIPDRIRTALDTAGLVVADLSDANANAFYEVGFRHGRDLPFVLVCRADEPIPFVFTTYEVTRIDAIYREDKGKYFLADEDTFIANFKKQVADARQKSQGRRDRRSADTGYRVRVFEWTTSYSPSIAEDWLAALDDPTRVCIESAQSEDIRSRIFRAEYKSLKEAASKCWVGNVSYFLHSGTSELSMGYAAYQFPTGPLVIPLSGVERQSGLAEITFDQPEREISELQVKLPRYRFTVRFEREEGGWRGLIRHPATNTLVGEAHLAPKAGFPFDS